MANKDNGVQSLRFILPDWDDIVDPDFDFVNETFSAKYKENRYLYGARIWDFFEDPPIDGVLVSRSIIEMPKSKRTLIERHGIKNFLKLPQHLRDPRRFQVIGDCGAWQYRYDDVPRYDPLETLDFYQRIGVDYGVSVDHIAFFGDPQERMRITFENAVKSYEKWKRLYEKGDYSFVLLAAVQGIEIEDYSRMLEKLYARGYRNFAIGGLAKRDSNFIAKLVVRLEDIAKRYRDIEKIHFLGIARPSLVRYFVKLVDLVSEVSFDNATYLRIAWTRSHENYVTLDGYVYTAIRVRPGSKGELEVLKALRDYDEERLSLEETVKILEKYVATNGDLHYLPYYVKTLKDRPWRKCSCPICKSIGIDVIIFRGNDRNRRRGFHNLYVFYKLLKSDAYLRRSRFVIAKEPGVGVPNARAPERLAMDLSKVRRVLVLTNCSDKKSIDRGSVLSVLKSRGLGMPSFDIENEDMYKKILKSFIKPAEEMYSGTFSYVKKLVSALRSAGKEVDFYIVSARYGVIRSDTPIIPYDASLNALDKDKLMKWVESRKVVETVKKILNLGRYDTIIVILTSAYAKALKEVIRELMYYENAVLVIPTSIISSIVSRREYKGRDPVKAHIIPGGSLTRRVKALKSLIEMIKGYSIRTLDSYAKGS